MEFSAEKNTKLRLLNDELSKTSVISDQFKGFIMATASEAAAEAFSVNIDTKPEEPNLAEELLNRQFNSKASVRLKCRNLLEFFNKVDHNAGLSRGLGLYLGKYYPTRSGLVVLLSGSQSDIVTVREWLWMEINSHIERFAEIVGF